ncbi:DUF4767 domain-containing protein [Streptococcus pacificus]|uniref:DUF4767 domain-containing protein n=1 Tax=Streptococcus pacificus TaxID=2740577 RepID=A0ABS0ZHQ4_9STRE|nr:DUF4767 domain-containing protein [Streptococcus pacificus]MBJ8325534.1 DUF4767 domain-containing protein [Streptococcus pacificus]
MKKNKRGLILFGVVVLFALFVWFVWGQSLSKDKPTTSSDNKVEVTKKDSESTNKKEEKTTTTETKEQKENNEKHLWTVEKAQALQTFISEWQVEMNQFYTSYTPDHPLNYYGYLTPTTSPDESDTMTPALNDSPIKVEWSDTGDNPDVYNLVAVYSDYEANTLDVKHLYYFVIKDGQAMVLHTSQNQGNENNWLYFTETENLDLKNGFKTIVGQ